MKISNKEIATLIKKTPSAVSYLKKSNKQEYEILKLGVLCIKLELNSKDLEAMYTLKKIELKS